MVDLKIEQMAQQNEALQLERMIMSLEKSMYYHSKTNYRISSYR